MCLIVVFLSSLLFIEISPAQSFCNTNNWLHGCVFILLIIIYGQWTKFYCYYFLMFWKLLTLSLSLFCHPDEWVVCFKQWECSALLTTRDPLLAVRKGDFSWCIRNNVKEEILIALLFQTSSGNSYNHESCHQILIRRLSAISGEFLHCKSAPPL